MTNLSSIAWPDVVAVGIRTTGDGPGAEDLFWQLVLRDRFIELPGACVDGPAFDELVARLPGLDHQKIIRAMGSTAARVFRVWHRDDARFCPDRDQLAARFCALVGKVGGDPRAAPPVFERAYAAWSAPARRYHNVEHLVDCLRELDTASPDEPTAELAELALWYHDLVYEPGADDCEERSARALTEDAIALAIPAQAAQLAAELVRATAHGHAPAASPSAAADLVVDIDLAILGRDALRFMDYEHSIEEEYAPTSVTRFRCGRGRFLAALLARETIFRTAHGRSRYESRARAQITALLASPRYRSYRWLRRVPRWLRLR